MHDLCILGDRYSNHIYLMSIYIFIMFGLVRGDTNHQTNTQKYIRDTIKNMLTLASRYGNLILNQTLGFEI